MKTLTISLLIIIVAACTAQEPDIHCYSQEYVDSVVLSCVEGYSQEYLDSVAGEYLLRIDNQISIIESLLQNPNLTGDQNITVSDTAGYNFRVCSELGNRWYTLYDDQERIHLWLVDDELELWAGDSTQTKLLVRWKMPLP